MKTEVVLKSFLYLLRLVLPWFNENRSCIEIEDMLLRAFLSGMFNENRSCIEILAGAGGSTFVYSLMKTEVVLKSG